MGVIAGDLVERARDLLAVQVRGQALERGRHHVGGGSHGSLLDGDSLVPMLVVGEAEPPGSITGVAPLVLKHFGVKAPSYARAA